MRSGRSSASVRSAATTRRASSSTAILIPLLNDCVRVLDEARVTPEDLDAGMKHGAGWPMGPCELVDLVGIDVHVHASEALWEKLAGAADGAAPRLVRWRTRASSAARAAVASTHTTLGA